MMPFYRRGFLYLVRKRAKSLLLLLIFLAVNTMLLGTGMILRAAENSEDSLKAQMKAKAICEITEADKQITEENVAEIRNLRNVTSVNRMSSHIARLPEGTPLTASGSAAEENRQVNLCAYDDLEQDSPFADQSCRLTEGSLFSVGGDGAFRCAVVHEDLAQVNGWKAGDEIFLENDEGKRVSAIITGLYRTGNESRQNAELPAVSRVENQIYVKQETYEELFGPEGFSRISVYTGQPDAMGELVAELEKILGDRADISTSDMLFRQMKAPLEQTVRVVELMRVLTLAVGAVIITLILCMWMRSRQREIAVYLSLGEKKCHIFLQAVQESGVLFLAAAAVACVLGTAVAGGIQNALAVFEGWDAAAAGIDWQITDLTQLLGTGGAVALSAVLISLLPLLRTSPRDVLARMEG